MSRSGPVRVRRGLRIAVAFVLLLALAGVFGAMVLELRSGIDAQSRAVAAQRSGVAYLRPLVRLVAELSRAQSAATRNVAVDLPALNSAIAAVSEVDKDHGQTLRTSTRWSDLRAALPPKGVVGAAAMQPYLDVLALAGDLVATVGNESNLLVAPDRDAFHLADAALVWLPTILTRSAAAAGYAQVATEETAEDGQVDVALAQVATAAESLERGLRVAMESGSAAGVAGALDVFSTAVDQLVPPAAVRSSGTPVSPGALARAAADIHTAALPLAAAVLDELDRILADEEAAAIARRTRALAVGSAGLALGVILLWWCVPPRERAADEAGGAPTPDVAAVSVQVPAVDARDLLAIEELMHVGRGVRARPRDEADDAG